MSPGARAVSDTYDGRCYPFWYLAIFLPDWKYVQKRGRLQLLLVGSDEEEDKDTRETKQQFEGSLDTLDTLNGNIWPFSRMHETWTVQGHGTPSPRVID
jgi:hypothetical protein